MAEEKRNDWNELLREAQKGDIASQNELCQKICVRLREFIQYRLWGWPSQILEDILQDSLVIFVKKLDQINTNPQKYAVKIMQNKIGDALRSRQAKREVAIDSTKSQNSNQGVVLGERNSEMADTRVSFAEDVEVRDLILLIKREIKKLPKHCQIYFSALLEGKMVGEVWRFFKELEPDLKRASFDSRVHRCRQRLWQSLKPHLGS